jgi:hypothetical protein
VSVTGVNKIVSSLEAIHMIRKGQAYGSAAGAKVDLLHRFIVSMFGIEASFIRLSHSAAFDFKVATLPRFSVA